MKILIIGGVAGGVSEAVKLRRFSEEDQIIMFEKGPHVSFSNCTLPYHLSGMIEPAQKLVLMTPEKFKKQYQIEARVNQEVIYIDRNSKVVKILDLLTNNTYEESYDKLILSPGAKPNHLDIPGIENLPAFTIRNVVDISRIKTYLIENQLKQVTIVGGGYIGIEVAENIREAGYEAILVEGASQVLHTFEKEMAQIFHKVLHDHGIKQFIKEKKMRLNYNKVHFILADKVGLMPDSHPMHFKLIFEKPSGKVLGIQAIGKGNVDKRIDVIATAIKLGATIYDLKDLELCYAPHFGTAKDIVNYAEYIACNILEE